MPDKHGEHVDLEETSSRVYNVKGWKFRFDNTWTPANVIQVTLLVFGLLWGGLKAYQLIQSVYDTQILQAKMLNDLQKTLDDEITALDNRVRTVELTQGVNVSRIERLERLERTN